MSNSAHKHRKAAPVSRRLQDVVYKWLRACSLTNIYSGTLLASLWCKPSCIHTSGKCILFTCWEGSNMSSCSIVVPFWRRAFFILWCTETTMCMICGDNGFTKLLLLQTEEFWHMQVHSWAQLCSHQAPYGLPTTRQTIDLWQESKSLEKKEMLLSQRFRRMAVMQALKKKIKWLCVIIYEKKVLWREKTVNGWKTLQCRGWRMKEEFVMLFYKR